MAIYFTKNIVSVNYLRHTVFGLYSIRVQQLNACIISQIFNAYTFHRGLNKDGLCMWYTDIKKTCRRVLKRNSFH